MKTFKFKSEKQLDKFDEIFNFSGALGDVWIYGEDTDKWFTLQCLDDHWMLQRIGGIINNGCWRKNKYGVVNIYPSTYTELIKMINVFLKDEKL